MEGDLAARERLEAGRVNHEPGGPAFVGIWTGDRGNVAGRPGWSDGQDLAQPGPATWNAPEWTFRALFQRVGGTAFRRSRGDGQDAVHFRAGKRHALGGSLSQDSHRGRAAGRHRGHHGGVPPGRPGPGVTGRDGGVAPLWPPRTASSEGQRHRLSGTSLVVQRTWLGAQPPDLQLRGWPDAGNDETLTSSDLRLAPSRSSAFLPNA